MSFVDTKSIILEHIRLSVSSCEYGISVCVWDVQMNIQYSR